MGLLERLPDVFPRDDESDFTTFIDAHQAEVDGLRDDLMQVQRSLQINHAEDQSLTLIGNDFGRLGARRGRDDEAYRSYLRSLVPAFDGRGTTGDVRFAVAAGLTIDMAAVSLREDFDAVEYEVVLEDWEAHKTGIIREMAELADPAAVSRRDPIHYRRPDATVGLRGSSTETNTLNTAGLSSSSLQELSSGSTWNLP